MPWGNSLFLTAPTAPTGRSERLHTRAHILRLGERLSFHPVATIMTLVDFKPGMSNEIGFAFKFYRISWVKLFVSPFIQWQYMDKHCLRHCGCSGPHHSSCSSLQRIDIKCIATSAGKSDLWCEMLKQLVWPCFRRAGLWHSFISQSPRLWL